jgi:hypothetical protein
MDEVEDLDDLFYITTFMDDEEVGLLSWTKTLDG